MSTPDPTVLATVLTTLRRGGEHADDLDGVRAWLDETLDKTAGSWQMAWAKGGENLAQLDAQLLLVACLRDVLGLAPSKTPMELVEVGGHQAARYCTRCHHMAVKGTGTWTCAEGCVCAIAGGCLPGGKVFG